MTNSAVDRIRNLLIPALAHCREQKFSVLTFILEVALAELSQQSAGRASDKVPDRTPTPVSEDRAPDVIGSWNWDIINKVVYADPDVAVIYNVTPEAAERGFPQDEFGAAIYCEDMSKVAHAVSHTLSEGGGFSVVYRLVQANGSLKAVLAVGRAIFKNGSPTNFKGTIIDVTDDDARRARGMKYKVPDSLPGQAQG
jgi:PAS domain-containing protein